MWVLVFHTYSICIQNMKDATATFLVVYTYYNIPLPRYHKFDAKTTDFHIQS